METQTFSLEAVSRAKERWMLTFAPDHLELRAPDGAESIRIARGEAAERITTQRWPGGPLLHVKIPKNTTFRASPELLEVLSRWRGPLTTADLRAALKRRLGWAVPLAVLIIFTSLPFAGDPEAGIAPLPLDRVGMFLGGSLLALAVLRRVWPTPRIFLADTVWFLLLALDLVHGALADDRQWVLMLVPLVLWGAWGSFRDYERFADALGARPEPARGPEPSSPPYAP